jgi:hypothetical protein
VRSFDGSDNRLAFVALKADSQRVYCSTLARLVLFCTRHAAAAVPGVPALLPAVAAAANALAVTPTTANIEALLELLFRPHEPAPNPDQNDPVTWFVRLGSFAGAKTLSVQQVHRTCAQLIYSIRFDFDSLISLRLN